MQTEPAPYEAPVNSWLVESAQLPPAGPRALVRRYPLASVGLLFGGGVLLGAVAHRVFEHRVTLGELLAERTGLHGMKQRLSALRH